MHAGDLSAQLPKLDSGDLDDTSSATETASIADSDAPSEAALHSSGDFVGGPQAAPLLAAQQAQITPEQGSMRRSFRMPGMIALLSAACCVSDWCPLNTTAVTKRKAKCQSAVRMLRSSILSGLFPTM